MRIYISGPITGRDWFESFYAFGDAERRIIKEGHEAINPMAISLYGLSWDLYMRLATEIIGSGEVDGIVMLRGWEKSKGAVIEYQWAKSMGIPIGFQSVMDEKMYGGA